MITIPDANNATHVWIGFSEVEWTPKVLEKHQEASWRQKNMKCIDIQKILANTPQPHVSSLKQLGKKIAEYACDPIKATAPGAFYQAAFHFSPRRNNLLSFS